MFPEVVKSNDQCKDAELTYVNYMISGSTSTPSTTTTLRQTSGLGGITVAGFNRTRNFKKGVFSINPFSIVRRGRKCTGVTKLKLFIPWYGSLICVRELSGDLPMFCSPPFQAFYPVPLPNIPLPDADLIISASAKSKAADILLGVTAKELPETLGLLVSPFSRLPKALAKLAPKKARKGRKALDYAANAWLSYQFGILPLMSEIDAARSLVNSKLEVSTDILKSRAKRVEPSIVSETSFTRNLGFCKVRGSQYVRRSTVMRASAYTAAALTGAQRLGLDVSNIPATLWEMIPYSFVVDWFFDVGSWLSYITPRGGVIDLGVTTSGKTIDNSGIFISNVSADGQLWTSSGGSAIMDSISYARTVAPLQGYYPSLQTSIDNVKHIIDGLTLSYQKAKPYLITR